MCVPTKSIINKKWVLKQRPDGIFDAEKDAELITETLLFASCKEEEVIVETHVLSVDAFIRTMMDAEAYHGSIPVGGTIPAFGYGKVVHSNSKKFKVGQEVLSMLGAQTHSIVKASELHSKLNFPFMPPHSCLGLLGLTSGFTAYAGTFYVCKPPRKGETAVVTGAAGAVGNIAAQLAKSTGARVVGIAGGEHKSSFLTKSLKLDAAVDYKSKTQTLEEQIKQTCPDGIDFVYDNVGGETLDILLDKINIKGRVVICGAISQYSGNLNKGKVRGPSNYLKLAERGAEMKGFNVMQYMSKILFMLFGIFWMYMRGKVYMPEHVEHGVESFPKSLQKLFTGGHIGKMIVQVKETKTKSA